MSHAQKTHTDELDAIAQELDELDAIAQELHDIVRQKGVTLQEAENIYGRAATITRNQPEIRKLREQYHNARIS